MNKLTPIFIAGAFVIAGGSPTRSPRWTSKDKERP